MFGDLNEKQEEYLDDILTSADHLLALINDILDLSKVEAGQIELEMAPFSLREALERGVVMVRERATKDGVRVALEAYPEVDIVSGDERRVRQVIFNLLSNAVKFTPQGGTVDVSAVRVNGEVRVSVADTGPGIAPEDHDRIFEEFQQTEAGAAQREGTGLGLALSKRLVELHGGRIWVDSELGQGEHVRVHAARRGRDSRGRRADPRRRGQREEHEALPRRAPGEGLPDDRGDDGRARRSRSRSSTSPDLVLMDIQLPDIDGIEALGRLRADERTAAVPVLAVTALAMDGDRERFLAAGFDGYVSEAGRHRRRSSPRWRALRGAQSMSADSARDPRGGRRPRERTPARGDARAPRLRRPLGRRRRGRPRARRVRAARTSSCSTS